MPQKSGIGANESTYEEEQPESNNAILRITGKLHHCTHQEPWLVIV